MEFALDLHRRMVMGLSLRELRRQCSLSAQRPFRRAHGVTVSWQHWFGDSASGFHLPKVVPRVTRVELHRRRRFTEFEHSTCDPTGYASCSETGIQIQCDRNIPALVRSALLQAIFGHRWIHAPRHSADTSTISSSEKTRPLRIGPT